MRLRRVQTLAQEVLPDSVSTSFQGRGRGLPVFARRHGDSCSRWPFSSSTWCWGSCTKASSTPSRFFSGLPSAGLGALATLLIFHDELNIYSFVGVIMLIGIVKKRNAIMMIDFAIESQRTSGALPADAIYQACLIRFPAHYDDYAIGLGRHPTHRAWIGALGEKPVVPWDWQ